MDWSASKVGTILATGKDQKPAHAIGLSTPPIGCVLDLPGVPGGGNKIYDRSPYGNHGTITGAVWKRLPSGLWVLDFDGNDDEVDFGDVLDMGLSDWTVSLWAKVTTGNGYVLGKQNDFDYNIGYTLYVASTTGLPRVYFGKGEPSLSISGTTNILGSFNLIFGTFDRDGYMRLYVNGVEEGTAVDISAYAATDISNSDHLYLGRRTDGTYCDGQFALARIYNRVLTALEIQNIFNREKYLFGVW